MLAQTCAKDITPNDSTRYNKTIHRIQSITETNYSSELVRRLAS